MSPRGLRNERNGRPELLSLQLRTVVMNEYVQYSGSLYSLPLKRSADTLIKNLSKNTVSRDAKL